MDPNASPNFAPRIADRFVTAGSIRRPHLHVAVPIAKTFSEVREEPCSDHIVGIEVLVKDTDPWFSHVNWLSPAAPICVPLVVQPELFPTKELPGELQPASPAVRERDVR